MGFRAFLAGAAALLASCAPTDTLERRLWELPHTYRTNWDCGDRDRGPPYDERYTTVRELMPAERAKAERLLDELRKPAFRKSIGAALEADVKDTRTEHGGVIVRDGLALKLELHYPNVFGKEDGNHSYHAPLSRWEAVKKPDYFAHYHFHASSDDNPDFAGPSPGDLGSLKQDLPLRKDACGAVITKLAGKKFNVDIYFDPSVIEVHGIYLADGTVLDLGDYPYE